ncbi:sodium/potassium-transporting ATPase subunit beta-1-like isoform X2 [Clavelina lepadiformis]|uniref:sodium/potassium-transporting ATPase subunit beta-1-like isoform X2 n=1 Tax=Clavelina lepadiformis TaxID=159417 RepID=UPI004040EF38
MSSKQSVPWTVTARKTLRDFGTFLIDTENRTVMGRTANNWGQILIFYAVYYAFLAGLFAAALSIVLGILDPYVPRFQTRLQAPGLTIQPRLPSREALTSDIRFTASDPDSYAQYTTQLTEFLKQYEKQSDTDFFQPNCTNGKVQIYQGFAEGDIARSCPFKTADLGPCGSGEFGYDEGKPCIYVKVNRIINWYPVGFTDITAATGQSQAQASAVSRAPPLRDVLSVNGGSYDPYKMYISCYGWSDEDRINLNGESNLVSINTKYYPADNGIPFMYYPYYGNLRQPEFVTPVVAVQFTNVTRGQEIKVTCKAYARNIEDDERMSIGYYSFPLKID